MQDPAPGIKTEDAVIPQRDPWEIRGVWGVWFRVFRKSYRAGAPSSTLGDKRVRVGERTGGCGVGPMGCNDGSSQQSYLTGGHHLVDN